MSDLSDQMGVLARQAQAWAEHAGESAMLPRPSTRAVTTGCTASLTTAGAVHDCDWTEPHPGHAHHNHQAGATWTGATWRDLGTQGGEVEALRTLACMGAYKDAYATVLDLIDKHIREGQ